MQTIKLRLTALSPIHIGTGEHYEPTNFVIDNGYLYEFDEIEFFQKLNTDQQKEFLRAVESKAQDSLFQIHRIIKNNKKHAIESAYYKVQVSKGIEKAYQNKIGRAVQIEGGRRKSKTKVFNQFLIEKTIRLSNSYRVYIPGSSIKGSISTALQEMIFKKNRGLYKKLFENANPNENFMKEVSIADTVPIKTFSVIGYALNKERFEDDSLGPKNIIEVIFSNEKQNSIFETTLTLKDEFCQLPYQTNIEEIRKACNKHYYPIFEQMMNGYAYFKGKTTDDFTNEYFSGMFYEKYKEFKPKENQFLIRVGKYSQARAVTIDECRRIRVKISGGGPKRKPNRWETLDQETTSWLFGFSEDSNQNLLPFGWVLCEIVDIKDNL